jgi:hypothetical protein
MSDGSELMHSHKYIEKYQKNGKWYYVYDEDKGTKNLKSTTTKSNNLTGTTKTYTYNKNVDDRTEKEDTTITKVSNAVKNTVTSIKDKSGLTDRKMMKQNESAAAKLNEWASESASNSQWQLKVNKDKNTAVEYTRNAREKTIRASYYKQQAKSYADAYAKTPLGKIENKVSSAKSWLEKKLKKSK